MALLPYWQDEIEKRQRPKGFSRHVPFMYHRRLLLLAAVTVLALAPAAAQMVRLTVLEGGERRKDAESRLEARRTLPNVRGSITDRTGRILAIDRPAYDVAVDYRLITDAWAGDMALRQARRLHARQWPELDDVQRSALMQRYVPEYEMRLGAMWDEMARLGGLSREELDERRQEIKRYVNRLASYVTEQKRREEAARLARERAMSPDEADQAVSANEVRRDIREERAAHVLLRDVPDTVAFEFMRRRAEADERDEWAGVEVIDAGRREYPGQVMSVDVDLSTLPGPLRRDETRTLIVSGVTTHIVGWMRNGVQREDEERRARLFAQRHGVALDEYKISADRGAYRPGDRVGHFGMEAGAEYDLRGMRGVEIHRRDTGEVTTVAPENGRNVALTIDAALQAHVHALFDPTVGLAVVQPWNQQDLATEEGRLRAGVPTRGQRLNGAVAIIEVDTSDILALVTVPSFTREAWQRNAEQIIKDEIDRPFWNRAIALPYAAGSIVKPLILCGACASGAYHVNEQVACTGHLLPDDPTRLRCWIFKNSGWGQTHSNQFGRDLDGSDAIMGSCNIFFFEMGRRLGPKRISEWYRHFGVDRRDAEGRQRGFNLGIGIEFAGVIGRLDSAGAPTPDEAIQMGIGQGPIAWTPLHAATAYAALGRGGVFMSPRIRMDQEPEVYDLGIPGAAIAQALEGLRRSVREPEGTTHHLTLSSGEEAVRERIFNAPGIAVWAKSGTADASALLADLDGDGRKEIARDGDHSWCVCLVGREGDRPRYAIAVLVEYGGSGGKVAGPIANQVVHALVRHGYLSRSGGVAAN